MDEEIEKYSAKVIKELCQKWYNKGVQDGKNAAYREAHPDKHYCRECKYWNGERSSIGVVHTFVRLSVLHMKKIYSNT